MGISSNTVSDRSLITGSRDKWRCNFGSQTEVNARFSSDINANDQFRFEGNAQGARYAVFSRSSLNKAVTSILKGLDSFQMPTRIGVGMSLSQRISGEAFIIEAVAVNDVGAVPAGEDGHFGTAVNVVGASATGSIVTFKTDADADFFYDDWVCVYDLPDTRMSVFGRITTVTDPRTFAVTAEQAVGTITYAAMAGKVCKVNLAGAATDSVGFMASGPTVNNGYFFNSNESSPILCSAYTSIATNWTQENIPVAMPYTSNKQPRFTTELLMTVDAVKMNVVNSDSVANTVFALKRTQNLPSLDKKYVVRAKALSLPNALPAIEIVSMTKTGTTTATVVTRTPHGLTTGGYVRAYGSNDSTNFPNVTTEVAVTVTNPTTVTFVWGGAVTATSYGGILKPVHAGMVTGIQAASVRAGSWRAGKLWLGTSAAPTLSVGETVRLQGLAIVGGVQIGEGRYRVVAVSPIASSSDASTTNASTTVTVADTNKYAPGILVTGAGIPASTFVQSITNATTLVLSAAATATATGVTITQVGLLLEPIDATVQADATRFDVRAGGGALVKETDFCLHFLRSLDHTRTPVEVVSGHQSTDISLSVPVVVNSIPAVTANEGSFAAQSVSQISSAASTNATSVKATAGTIYAMSISNLGATDIFVKLYNKASAPTVGTDVPRYVIKVAANSDRMVEFGRAGIRYTTGIALAITGAQAIADTTAVAANQVLVDTSYA